MKGFFKGLSEFFLDPVLFLIACVFIIIGVFFSVMYVNFKAYSSAMNYSDCVYKHVDLNLYRGLSLDKKYEIIQKYKCEVNNVKD